MDGVNRQNILFEAPFINVTNPHRQKPLFKLRLYLCIIRMVPRINSFLENVLIRFLFVLLKERSEIMTKKEYLEKLDSLEFDKNKYCIISGGVMLMLGLRDETSDIDLKVKPDYFQELQKKYNFKKSDKFP